MRPWLTSKIQARQVARNDEVRLSFELGTDSAAVVRELSRPDVAEQPPSRLEEGGQLSLARGEVALALDEFGIRAEAGAAAEIERQMNAQAERAGPAHGIDEMAIPHLRRQPEVIAAAGAG